MFQSKSQKIVSFIVFALYFALLVWLVLFKFQIHFGALHHVRAINMIPFAYDAESNFSLHVQEMFYNVLIFVPLGMYVNIYQPDWTFWKKILLCFAVSLLFEVSQFVFALGVSDITDLITNTLGGSIGILLFTLARKLFSQKSISIINMLGFATEGVAVMLLTILLIANG